MDGHTSYAVVFDAVAAAAPASPAAAIPVAGE